MIADLKWPGTWLDFSDREAAFEVESLLHTLTSALTDANLALLLFCGAIDRSAERMEGLLSSAPGTANPDANWDAKRQIEDELLAAAEVEALTPQARWQLLDSIRLDAEIQWKQQRWRDGHLPTGLLDREIFMHARSFVYAIDSVWKVLGVIAKSPVPNEAGAARDDLKRHLPHLTSVRDTTHHHEDRARGLDRNGKPLARRPIENGLVYAPEGGVIMLDSLAGDRYTCTLNDGTVGDVPVNEESLRAVQAAVQRTLDSMPWTGSPMHWPSDH